MREAWLFLKDVSLISAILVILGIEILLQTGCYRPFLKKNSYAQNVNRITNIAIKSSAELKPNVIILGSSIAYEGISPEILNQKLDGTGIKIQSIAIPGSELVVQDLALRKFLENNDNIQYVLHINDLQLPWVDRRELIDPTLSMIGEMDRIEGIRRIILDRYDIKLYDYIFLLSRLVAYRRDFADFILAPNRRIKDFGRERKLVQNSLYSYTNEYMISMKIYEFKNFQDCIMKTNSMSPIPEGSDIYHRDAIYNTCHLSLNTKVSLEKNELTDLYGFRLNNLYSYIRSKNIKIISIIPPSSNYFDPIEINNLKLFWKNEYGSILGDENWDLSDAIPEENNSSYYFDLVHFNKSGMEKFTEKILINLLKIKSEFQN